MFIKHKSQKYRRIYSLRINEELKKRGFRYVTTASNPKKPEFTCWVYEATPAFIKAFQEIKENMKGD